MTVLNHAGGTVDLRRLGTIPADRIGELSDGLLRARCRCASSTGPSSSTTWRWSSGPVFPHEVVGFSGGNKYLFPGVVGPEIIDLSHWLGALITSARSSAPAG